MSRKDIYLCHTGQCLKVYSDSTVTPGTRMKTLHSQNLTLAGKIDNKQRTCKYLIQCRVKTSAMKSKRGADRAVLGRTGPGSLLQESNS